MTLRLDDRVEWIRGCVRDAVKLGVVIGVSGGVDSAVVAALCKRAFPQTHLALLMPCESSPLDGRDAMSVVDALTLRYETIDLLLVYRTMRKAMSIISEFAGQQLKARLRMATLYFYANAYDLLVVGTTNRAEYELGYFTKYGDGGVDIEPIADMLKRDVKEAAHQLGVPQTIIDKAPSAGLYPGQTDEAELGIIYEEIDEMIADERRPNIRFLELKATSEHKRRTPLSFPNTPR